MHNRKRFDAILPRGRGLPGQLRGPVFRHVIIYRKPDRATAGATSIGALGANQTVDQVTYTTSCALSRIGYTIQEKAQLCISKPSTLSVYHVVYHAKRPWTHLVLRRTTYHPNTGANHSNAFRISHLDLSLNGISAAPFSGLTVVSLSPSTVPARVAADVNRPSRWYPSINLSFSSHRSRNHLSNAAASSGLASAPRVTSSADTLPNGMSDCAYSRR